ncbi:hypothetical protein [Ensifer sp.]|jgi:hypothetical protein|uniref:hypothetical protein n=1 Tax=Ensifer sp. TaxID=1872086 RepID=UPI002E129840|nr:hypothetical protein [Ensifer sp.]
MFLKPLDLREAFEQWRDIVLTSLPSDKLGGYVALRRHDLTIDLCSLDGDSDLLVFLLESEALVERFRLGYPYIVTYGGNPGYPLEYLVWLSFQMQANFERLGALEMSAFHANEDDDTQSIEALAMGFSRQTDLDAFVVRFDGKDLHLDPVLGYQAYLSEVATN